MATATTSRWSRPTPGYVGDAHDHTDTEFLFVVEGALRTQGRTMTKGDAYVATPGSHHDAVPHATDGATYLSIFKL